MVWGIKLAVGPEKRGGQGGCWNLMPLAGPARFASGPNACVERWNRRWRWECLYGTNMCILLIRRATFDNVVMIVCIGAGGGMHM